MREVVLDTETTGLDVLAGHRVVEIGCVELINHVPTGGSWQTYLNPQRENEREAFNVHGLSDGFLSNQPFFRDKAEDFMAFLGNSTIVIHNAEFDLGFLNAEFARLGGLHRNTLINSPRLLDSRLRLKTDPRLRFAGQITGVEGYVESAAIGLLAGRLAATERLGSEMEFPPETTALGALIGHITTGADAKSFQPMNVNFGLFPVIEPEPAEEGKKRRKLKGADRKRAMSRRALTDLDQWLAKDRLAAE